jgi:tetratricopeptide (TPR) repeat protein
MYGNHGENLISGKNYESDSQDIFKTLSQAVEDTSLSLEEFTGFRSIDVDDYFNTDIAAYEYYLKGKSYYQTNKPEELQLAERMFEKALEIDPTLAYAPNDLETLLLLSLVNMDLRKYTVAMATLHRAIELAPDYGRAFYNLAAVYMKLGVIELAVKYKGDPNAYTDGAYAYIVNGEYDKAKKLLDKSIDE